MKKIIIMAMMIVVSSISFSTLEDNDNNLEEFGMNYIQKYEAKSEMLSRGQDKLVMEFKGDYDFIEDTLINDNREGRE